MNACVCDKCGRVVLFSDKPDWMPKGINRMQGYGLPGGVLDLCDQCVAELMEAVRTVKEEEPE